MMQKTDRRSFLGACAGAGLALWLPAIARAAASAGATTGADSAAGRFWEGSWTGLDGQTHPAASWRGQPLVVNFWATWCAPCVKEMPELSELQAERPGSRFIGIAVDTAPNVRKFLEKVPVSYPQVIGGPGAIDLMRALGNGPGGLPFTVVFAADGSISAKKLGVLNMKELTSWLEAVGG